MDHWFSIKRLCDQALCDFEACLDAPQQRQADILQAILQANVSSIFGQQHGFDTIKDYKTFSKSVAVADYDAFQAAITASADGQQQQLTASTIIQFEETSGSSSGAKLIPYTADLLLAFQRAVLPWLGDLLHSRPAITQGRIFFMISPALRPPAVTKGGIPIGAGNDLAYFGQPLANHLAQVTLWSPLLAQPQPVKQWKKNLSLLLLQTPDLTLISLWSPTLLIELIDYIITHKNELLNDITEHQHHKRIQSAISKDTIDTQQVWQQLDTISCWDSHTSAAYAQKLQQLFPHAIIQGKGLLATEAVTSLPFTKTSQPILAVNSHFYEFIDKDKRTVLAHELTVGEVYRVIVTTQAGLYRYDTGDMVKVTGYYKKTPMLIFVGRSGLSSDLCGEKLTEIFVGQAIAKIDSSLVGQSLLVAVNDSKPYYCWVLGRPIKQADKTILRQKLEKNLCQNPQYQYALDIGQLGRLKIETVTDINQYYQRQTAYKNRRLSTIKLPTLLPTRRL